MTWPKKVTLSRHFTFIHSWSALRTCIYAPDFRQHTGLFYVERTRHPHPSKTKPITSRTMRDEANMTVLFHAACSCRTNAQVRIYLWKLSASTGDAHVCVTRFVYLTHIWIALSERAARSRYARTWMYPRIPHPLRDLRNLSLSILHPRTRVTSCGVHQPDDLICRVCEYGWISSGYRTDGRGRKKLKKCVQF